MAWLLELFEHATLPSSQDVCDLSQNFVSLLKQKHIEQNILAIFRPSSSSYYMASFHWIKTLSFKSWRKLSEPRGKKTFLIQLQGENNCTFLTLQTKQYFLQRQKKQPLQSAFPGCLACCRLSSIDTLHANIKLSVKFVLRLKPNSDVLLRIPLPANWKYDSKFQVEKAWSNVCGHEIPHQVVALNIYCSTKTKNDVVEYDK